MGRAFEESERAYENGDGARAKQLSEEGKRFKGEMENLNLQAADWIYHGKTQFYTLQHILIFAANNTDSAPNEVDLHGLYVKEAIARTEQAVEAAQQRGDSNIHLIVGRFALFYVLLIWTGGVVGKGLHSQDHVAKLKPAIEDLMVK